ncbi:hypothetical protein ACSBR2_018936 [Camellia fascicularis]
MERLMIVGLWCAHPNNNLWPSIKQVLNFEAPLPNLPTKLPALTFLSPPVNTHTSSVSLIHGAPIYESSETQSTNSSYNTDSLKFTSSSPPSSPSVSLSNTKIS